MLAALDQGGWRQCEEVFGPEHMRVLVDRRRRTADPQTSTFAGARQVVYPVVSYGIAGVLQAALGISDFNAMALISDRVST